MDLFLMRKEYIMKSLNEGDVLEEPLAQFKKWFNESKEAAVPEPNAMTLATCTPEGKPAARIVLLKEITGEGFVFFTNYESRKARELAENPFASLVFLWHELERQVRVEGIVEKISREESENYFYSRPFQSQVSALISPQSQVINGKEELHRLHQKTYALHDGGKVPFPANWGGFIVIPTVIEFWQGRESRFHDRLQYTKRENGWKLERLAP